MGHFDEPGWGDSMSAVTSCELACASDALQVVTSSRSSPVTPERASIRDAQRLVANHRGEHRLLVGWVVTREVGVA